MLGLILLMVGCASQPIVYPNAQYQQEGPEGLQAALEECKTLANQAGASRLQYVGKRSAMGTLRGAAYGAASGAVGGAISGGAGIGAAIGAASGATWGLLSSLFSASTQPHPAFRNFVNRCLRDRGYEVVGWE
ncbi:MAG TPA: hypothetical protein ENJ86_10985 [Methylothermaceae bacterium]|nr:hypothetical protein [Methylothermaceae bacterium]